jgi:hypothetical protein
LGRELIELRLSQQGYGMKEYRELILSLIGLLISLIGFATEISQLTVDATLLRAIVLLGYVVFAGGILWFAFKGINVKSKWRWASLGALYGLTIPFFIWVGSWINLPAAQADNPCQEYGIEIIEPSAGYHLVNGSVTIRGNITKRPPERALQLIGIGGEKYWPHLVDQMEVTVTSWRGQSYGEGDYTAVIAYVGPNGRILFDYFQQVGEINNSYFGLDVLPEDVFQCGSVFIAGQ